MAAIGHQIVPKLRQLLLLLSSDQAGEVVAAAAAIERTLRAAGCDWHDLAAHLASPAKATRSAPANHRKAPSWNAIAVECLASGQLNPRECEFIHDVLLRWRGNLTPKQHDWLEAIHARVRRAA